MKRRFPLTAWAVLVVLLLSGGVARAALALGSRGPEVAALQADLAALGLYTGEPDGFFGPATREAVRAFQRKEGLSQDGVVGPLTRSRLMAATANGAQSLSYVVRPGDTLYALARRFGLPPERLAALNGLERQERLKVGQILTIPARTTAPSGLPARRLEDRGGVEVVPWAEANRLLPNGAVVRVTDVRSGLVFQVRRLQGTYHADCEPVSPADTAALKAAYGGRWSWARHPVIVEVDGRRLAASMNGYPHGRGDPQRNGFPGHFCLHFLGSRTHGTLAVDPDHQAAVWAAARVGERRRGAEEVSGPAGPAATASQRGEARPED